MEKFILGPLQEMWLKTLEEHPERQTTGTLGLEGENKYCCLGQALVCIAEHEGNPVTFSPSGNLRDESKGESNTGVLEFSFSKMGLFGPHGDIAKDENVFIRGIGFSYLSHANDSGVTWPEIAKFIRENPEKVFKESK